LNFAANLAIAGGIRRRFSGESRKRRYKAALPGFARALRKLRAADANLEAARRFLSYCYYAIHVIRKPLTLFGAML
jgi:hypothetical protein